MSTPFMPLEIEAPEPLTVPGGLTSLVPPLTPADTHWIGGYYYRTEEYAQHVRNWDGNRVVSGTDLGTDDVPEQVNVVPFMLEVEGEFSAMRPDRERLGDNTRRQLERHTSELLEHELWHGEIARGTTPDLPNKYLTKTGAVDLGTYADAMRGVSALVGEGAQMIHMPRQVALTMPQEMKNADWLDAFGFVIVAGQGYPMATLGTGDDETARIYGTKLVNIRLSDIEVLDSFDQGTNTYRYLAQRYGAVDFAGPVHTATVRF
jgi:hypothetical protein